MFVDTEERHARLKIRLEYDGFSKAEFFRILMTGYLDKDENVLKFINEYKEQKNIHNKKKRKGSRGLLEKGKETIRQFALEENEIENIFDIMEKEHPEL